MEVKFDLEKAWKGDLENNQGNKITLVYKEKSNTTHPFLFIHHTESGDAPIWHDELGKACESYSVLFFGENNIDIKIENNREQAIVLINKKTLQSIVITSANVIYSNDEYSSHPVEIAV